MARFLKNPIVLRNAKLSFRIAWRPKTGENRWWWGDDWEKEYGQAEALRIVRQQTKKK